MPKPIDHDMVSEILNMEDRSVGIFAVSYIHEQHKDDVQSWVDAFENMTLESLGQPDSAGRIKEFTVIDEGKRIRFYVKEGEYEMHWEAEELD